MHVDNISNFSDVIGIKSVAKMSEMNGAVAENSGDQPKMSKKAQKKLEKKAEKAEKKQQHKLQVTI